MVFNLRYNHYTTIKLICKYDFRYFLYNIFNVFDKKADIFQILIYRNVFYDTSCPRRQEVSKKRRLR